MVNGGGVEQKENTLNLDAQLLVRVRLLLKV
jgi:hypothetical protein